MTVSLYIDVHIPYPMTIELRRRGVDILTAQEDGAHRFRDPHLLNRATELGRVLVSSDKHFFPEVTNRQREGIFFSGVIHAPATGVSLGRLIADLEYFAKAGEPEDFINRIYYLPL